LQEVNPKLATALKTAQSPAQRKTTLIWCPKNWSLLRPTRTNLQDGQVIVLALDVLDSSPEKDVLVLT
jgi:hypothetical protein